MKRIIIFLTLAAVLLAACAPKAAPTPAPITLTDGLNRSVTLAGTPQRIVSLTPSNTEMLFAVGAGAQVVGRDEFSDYPAEAAALPSVGGSMGDYNLEAIAALKPDVVLAGALNTPEQVKALEDLDIRVYVLVNPADFDSLFAQLQTIGQITGHAAEADTLVAGLQARVQAVENKILPLSYAPLVFYELDGSDPAKPWTPGPNTFVSMLIRMAGGINIGDSLGSDWAQISQEALIQQNPAIILLGDAAYGVTPGQVAQRPGWDALQAVKDGQVLAFDDDLVSRPGPRMVDGLETLAKLLHPAVFD